MENLTSKRENERERESSLTSLTFHATYHFFFFYLDDGKNKTEKRSNKKTAVHSHFQSIKQVRTKYCKLKLDKDRSNSK